MDGSAAPEKLTPSTSPSPSPSPSPVPTPSPSSADAARLRRCVQSKLSWGRPAKLGGGGGGGGGAGAVAAPPAPAAEAVAEKEGGEEPEKGKRGRRPRKSEAARKPSSNKDTTGQDPNSKDELIFVDESPQKKQRKGKKQATALKLPNRKRCKALESDDGRGSCQQPNNSQNEAVLPEASSVLIDIDLMSVPSDTRHANDSFDMLDSQDKAQLIVDLRSEAKVAAEENRRLSSGKKMHPFFSSRKVNKGDGQGTLNFDDANAISDFERDPPFWPIHVVDQLETAMPIIWSKWLVAEGSSLHTSTANTKSVSFFEGLVKPLSIDTNCMRMHPDQLAERSIADCIAPGMGLPSFPDKQSENKFSSCQLAYYLWTDKYQPETAAQVCGNTEHVKFLSEWLKGWDERGHKKNKQIEAANWNINDGSCQDESDTDCSEDSSDCENVLLITGPVGCGKSAAVFACAREQGFNVIEVNTSDMRNGAYVRQKFEEATKSHGLEKWSQEEVASQPRNDSLDPVSRTPDKNEYKESPMSSRIAFYGDGQRSPVKCYSNFKFIDETPKQVINKTLILFEDVDTIFDEDRGFISTILKMAETTKWPIVLTSNKKDPSLPQLLDQLVLDFRYPSSAELLSHVEMICKSEGVNITVPQLIHIINTCSGDIRRTTMLLQFWYQGKQQYMDRLNKCLPGSFSLDLDAVHCVVPKMMPWDFPCKLSETVCMEIDKTILSAEKKIEQMELSEFEGLELQMAAPSTKGRNAAKQRKAKKSKLKRGCSAECNDTLPCKNDLDDFHDFPDTPVPSDQQRIRNQRVLLLSESDNDIADACTAEDARQTIAEVCLCPQSIEVHQLHDQGISNAAEGGFFSQPSEVPHLCGQGISNAFIQPSEVPQLNGQGISNQFCFPSESKEAFETTTFQNHYESNMAGSISQICDTFMSQDVSCVPESSFIVGGPSASISSDDFLSGLVSNELSTFHNCVTDTETTVPLEDTSNVKNPMVEPHKCMEDVVGETCEGYVELLGRNEEASCSTAGYQLMDECSRAESIWLLSRKKIDYSCKVEHVQDTWNRLRHCCPVLSHETNHNRAASAALKLASGVSDLISESDIMLALCYPLTNDILDPYSTPCAEPVDFSWYNRQLEIGSVYAEHALCIFSRSSQDTDDDFIDLSKELLIASTTATSLGKLISSGISSSDESANISHTKNPTSCISNRGKRLQLYESLHSVAPPKLSQSLKGPAFVDYLSSVSQISRLENSRLSEGKATSKQRRCRQTRHYLSSGALSLSSEDVDLLAQSGSFRLSVTDESKIFEQADD